MAFHHILTTSLVASMATVSTGSLKIHGGKIVDKNDPVAQMTVRLGEDGQTCTGTIIADDIIVTAAHCTNISVIRFGVNEKQSEVRASIACVRNPGFDPDHSQIHPNRWDIALLRFEGGLPEGFKRAEILPANVQMKIGETVTLAGFGQDDNDIYDTLNKTDVQITRLDDYSPIELVVDQTHGHGACYGDSGGPAFYNYDGKLNLVGVTNGPVDERKCDGEGVFQKVPAHAEWITKAIKALREASVQSEPTNCINSPE